MAIAEGGGIPGPFRWRNGLPVSDRAQAAEFLSDPQFVEPVNLCIEFGAELSD